MTVLASGILLYRDTADGPRLLLLRNRDGGHWGFAKGRRDPDDGHEVENARREVEEETGYRGLTLHEGFREQLSYRVRDDEGPDYPKRVTYFLARAPDHDPRLSDEHEEFRWAAPDEAASLLHYGQLQDLAARAFAALGAG